MGDTPTTLDRAIYQTVRYFGLFQQPVTATTIWRTLVIEQVLPGTTRWGGQRVWQLRDVMEQLRTSVWLAERVRQHWGYVYLAEQTGVVRQRLSRFCLAQDKWAHSRSVAWWLQYVPGVRMLALSGSLAQGHTTPRSDLDIFVITKTGRVWSTRLGLLLITQLLGRRRKHWDQQAPDKACLNHYVTEQSMLIPAAIRNLYTAVLYRSLIPVVGHDVAQQFWQVNASWVRRYLMYPEGPYLASHLAVRPWQIGVWLKSYVERMLDEPLFAWVESWAERIQRAQIAKHTIPGQSGRVVLSDRELAFHPDTKVPGLLRQFAQDRGQRPLL